MADCNYFESEDWLDRVRPAVAQWDLDDFVSNTDVVEERERFSETVLQRLATDADTLAEINASLGDVVDFLPATEREIMEAWTDRWGIETTCPHERATEDRCLFHAASDEKDDEAVREALLDRLADPETSFFVGATFGSLDLSTVVLGRDSNHTVDLRHARFGSLSLEDTTIDSEVTGAFATVEGDLSFENAVFGRRADFFGLAVEGNATLGHCDFDGRCRLGRSTFEGRFRAPYARFARGTSFRGATFGGGVTFRDADFSDVVSFDGATFRDAFEFRFGSVAGGARFEDASFAGKADFHDAEFSRGATLRRTTFDDEVDLQHATFATGTTFEETRFGGDVDFYDAAFGRVAKFLSTTFNGDARFTRVSFDRIARFEDATFRGEATFVWTIFREIARVHDVTFEATANFREAKIAELEFCDVSAAHSLELPQAYLEKGELRYTGSCDATYDLTEATLGDVRLRFAEDNPFEYLKIRETEFDGFQFSDSEHREYLKRNWRIHATGTAAAGSPDRIENTYLKAKNGANDVGDNRAASAFFLKEMKYRRKGYIEVAAEATPFERVVGAVKWVASWFFNITCGYGERPLNTIASAVGTIVLFAGLLYAAGVQFDSPVEYLLVSTQSFVALILGDLPNSGLDSLKVLTSIEAFVGAFFIGLFVFSLTRSIHR